MTIARDLANVASLMASSGANVVFDNTIVITGATAGTYAYFDAQKRLVTGATPGGGGGTGDVTGPASSVSGNIATFNGTTGKIIQDGGKALPSGTIVGTSDAQALSNKIISGSNNTFSNIPNSATTAASANGASTIVSRDINGDFSANRITANGAFLSSLSASNIVGTVAVTNGGTGLATIPALSIPVTNTLNTITALTASAGQSIRINAGGTAWESYTPTSGGGGGMSYVYRTSNYTASSSEGVLTDTTAGSFTVTLPATPSTGNTVSVADAGNSWGNNNLIVARNGSTIGNLAENLVCDITGAKVDLIYDGTTWEVYAQIGGQGGNAVISTTRVANGVLYFDSSNNALSNSNFVFNGSNVGIGTSSTVARLDVSGSQAGNIIAVAALDINCSQGNYFTKTIAADSTFTFSNVPSSRAYGFTLELTHTSGAVTWPGTVRWPANTAPSLTTGKTHLFVFVTDDAGSRWRGSSLVNYDN